MEARPPPVHRSVRGGSDTRVAVVSGHSPGRSPRQAPAMLPSTEEVQLLYERVERLAEQASIAEQLQRDNDELRTEVQELRGDARALRRENAALRSKERADASDMAVTNAVLTALHESELAQQTNREALIALRRHHAAQLAERDVEIGRLQNLARTASSDRAKAVSPAAAAALEASRYERSFSADPVQMAGASVRMSMSPMPPSPAGFRSGRVSDSEGWSAGGLS